MFTANPQSYFDDLYNNTSDLIQYVSRDGEIQAVNPSWLKVTGYQMEEVIGNKIYDFICLEDRERYFSYRHDVITGKSVEGIQFSVAGRNGRKINLEGHLRPYYHNNELIHTRGVFRDISYRKQQEEAVKSEFSKLNTFLSHAPSAIVVIDEKQRIKEWNKKAEEIFGYPREEVMDGTLSDYIIPVAFREAHNKGLQHFFLTGEGPILNRTIEVPAINKLRQEFPISLSISNTRINEQWYFIAFMNDLTEQRKAEADALQALKDLATAKAEGDRYKEFLSLASHELKTPLTSILAYSQIASREINNNNPSFVKKTIEQISLHSKKLALHINLLMDISRIQAGKLILNKASQNLNVFLKETIDSLQDIYPDNTINLEMDAAPIWLTFDALRLEQVFNNLINNAVKYSPTNKTIDVSSRRVPNQIEMSVTDYGSGIQAGLEHQVFDKFYQIDNIVKSDQSGLGMGLYVASEIIKKHGGTIWVESVPEVKTTFTFTLPIEPH